MIGGETIWSEMAGSETSRSKKFGAKRPGRETKTSGGETSWTKLSGGETSKSKMPWGETSWSKMSGVKRPGPKCQVPNVLSEKTGAKRPGPKRLSEKSGCENTS